jgi:Bacterial Ig-like domain (group 3)
VSFSIKRCLAVTAVAVSAVACAGSLAPAATATSTTHHVAYITDFGLGLSDPNPPNPSQPGSSIFTNAITGSPLASGGTYNGAMFFDVPVSAIDASPATALNGYDTAILYEVCTIGSHPAAVGAINSFLASGGKVMIFDADGCSTNTAGGGLGITADYSGFLFPFATNSPGPLGAQNYPYTFKEANTLTAGLPAPGVPIGDDAIGDGNVFTTHAGAWCVSLQGSNGGGAGGDIEAYARTAGGGLAIYEGEDFWFTDVHSYLFPSGGDPHLKLVFDNMLAQAWNPDGLPCTNPASGIKLDPVDATNTMGTSHTDTATVVNHDGTPDSGVTVTFAIISGPDAGQTATGVTDASGHATFTFTDTTAPGTDVVVASFVDSSGTLENSNQALKHWTQIATTLTYTGATTSDYNDAATVSATLQTSGGTVIPGEPIVFTLNGSETCTGTTDASGSASCSITPGEAAGSYTITASFAGDVSHVASSASAPFVVTLEETTLAYTGPTLIANGQPVTLSGVLKEDGATPIPGRSLTLTLGSGAGAQSCVGTTDAAGSASCTIAVVNQPLGSGMVSAVFAGDAYYLPASASATTLLYAFLGNGSFVVGDQSAKSGASVTFWGAQWWKLNSLSGGTAPTSFKGFASNPAVPACGVDWSTNPGNSAPPPAGPLPTYMAVIAAGTATKTGAQISGTTVHIVIVKTASGYAPNPGHAGTGTVVATIC